jgi:hypothetical protein
VPRPFKLQLSTSNYAFLTDMADNDIEDGLIDSTLLYIVENLRVEEEGNIEEPGQRISRKMGGPKAGQQYLEQLLNSGHFDRIKGAIRMSRDTFIALRNWLTSNTLLKASKHVSVDLKVAIFLYLTTRPASQRDTMERFSIANRVVSE